ncbi:IS110 family transposase [Aquimarina sp. BL5]|uniref:IS110 family transposase n=1 Tax=Aquimarina sp. BL5 TaxID=1714860 RepID=UPI000E49F30D|nr:IS110 family transposase [Aquimarina sp. BL5]AXT52106.1 IS110 family transposase [Aquimarina sp. BL5]AXT52849.1 IS110 family transposase [Aquimarina sp. BL5]RKN08821.1 IS110 family transposase [Aquimarina sp. BL5]
MNFKNVIGIDISKNTIDVCNHLDQKNAQFSNSKKGLQNFYLWVKSSKNEIEDVLFVYEHTGMYSHLITEFLTDKECHYHIAPALDIKRSMGITRGKDDVIDSKRIALYGYRLKDEITPTKSYSKSITQLKSLMSLKAKLIKQRAAYKGTLSEQKNIYKTKDFKIIFEVQEKMIRYITKQIKTLEYQILEVIKSQEALKQSLKLILSIKGVGMQMATTMIIATENFTKFKNWRKFASYCGVAPFPYQSGTSVKGRNKVSQLANKKIKVLIHMCSMVAIQHNPEMKKYYERRIEIGKNKMSTINIIRNKLIARIFAVIDRQTPYVDTMKFA